MARELTLEGRVTEVCRLAALAKRHYEVWRVYTEPTSRTRLWKSFDAYAAFMLLDEHAHHELAILYVTSLFETDRRTVHLRDLLENLRARGGAPGLVEETEAALSALEASANKVLILRNNAVGHRTARMSRLEVFERAAVTADELGGLISEAERLANNLATALGHQPLILVFNAAEALDQLFTDAGGQAVGGE